MLHVCITLEREGECGQYLTLDKTSQLAVEIHQRLKKKSHGWTLIDRHNPTETHDFESKDENREKMHAHETNTDKESGQLIGWTSRWLFWR